MSGLCVEGLVWLGRGATAPQSTVTKRVPPQKDCLVTIIVRVPEGHSALMMSRHHATFHNHQDGSTAGLSGNDNFQGIGEAQHPDNSDAHSISKG